jgi:D-amino peptidase
VRVFVSIALEGATGVAAGRQLRAASAARAAAMSALRADLTAALDGCSAAGATEVTVRDPLGVCDRRDALSACEERCRPARLEVVSGRVAACGPMAGIDDSFDAALLVGARAMAGTRAAVLDLTFSNEVFRVRVDDADEAGEIGLNAALAGSFGVPLVFVSGDDRACAEAQDLVPGVETAVVKLGLAHDTADLLAPTVAQARIRRGVERALRAAERPPALAWDERALRVVFTRSDFCDRAAACPGVERVDARTVRIERASFRESYRVLLACLELARPAD